MKSVNFERFKKTVTVGDTLLMKWENGKTEKHVVAKFSRVSNEPMTEDGKLLFLDYVVWERSILKKET